MWEIISDRQHQPASSLIVENELNFEISPEDSELGKKVTYDSLYNPEKLFAIAREKKRAELGISSKALPFYGFDVWNHYEVSWVNKKGKPIVALAEIIFKADSPKLIESKSMKLYFNSLNNTQYSSAQSLVDTIQKDLESRVQSKVIVNLLPMENLSSEKFFATLAGECLDTLDVACTVYEVAPSLLFTEEDRVEETLFSHLLRSNCLVTGQPDWGSVQITYIGKKINHASLLQYIVSFRNHTEFGEHCVERIFMDVMRQCQPSQLTVEGRYTRRGGIDINCYRSTQKEINISNRRLYRQ